ncbi:hypothetical protein TNCV_4650301 [Trichonephila clavipes]|nr:hypothetical protein TNCV_4650301 [Trichonephila clavipes]
MGIVCKTASVCTKISTTFAAPWTLSLETMAWLPLKLHHRQERLQRCRICVWGYCGERTLAECIRHRHTGPSPGVMVWCAIQYTCLSSFVRTDSPLNRARCISGVLRPDALLFFRAL